MSVHNVAGKLIGVNLAHRVVDGLEVDMLEFPHIFERDLFEERDIDEPMKHSGLVLDTQDEIYDIITALETNFALD